jgi:parallel beta-helix repeat protein/predicted outer membrane repeat protein
VTNLDDSGLGSLRQAILDTPAGGTVEFQPGLSGTIVLTTGELLLDKDLSIAGPGADVLTISGNHRSGVFDTIAGRPNVLSISGLMITNGSIGFGGHGGGIASFGTLTVNNCTLAGNSATGDGGGIYSYGPLTVSNCTVAGNSATGDGGGIDIEDGTLTISDCTLSSNSAGTGGGIYILNGLRAVTVTNSTLSANSASYTGGGIYNGSGSLDVTGSTISDNVAGTGGGIYNALNLGAGNTVALSGCTLSGNTAALAGGIYNIDRLTISDCTLSSNSATGAGSGGGRGGSIFNGEYGMIAVTDSTISGNSAGRAGGAIFADTMAIQTALRNTIIAGNTAPASPDVSGNLTSQGHNLIGIGDGGSGFDPTDLVGTPVNPIDPLLGPLQDNGGPTPTMALLPGSPAIDAGDNTDAPDWDQRGPGFPRIVNGLINIGAFEVQQAVAPTVTCSVAQSMLWPPNHRMVAVGLGVTVDPPDANVHVLVYANDNSSPADAAEIGPGTLQLRSERQGNGDGRVYLLMVTATNSGGTSFDACTVAVPHDHSARAAAQAYYQEFQTAPPGFRLLGEGPDGGGAATAPSQGGRSALSGDLLGAVLRAPATPPTFLHQAPLRGADHAAGPTGHLLPSWASLPGDGYFAAAHDGGFGLALPRLEQAEWGEASASALDVVLSEDWLGV